MPTHEHGIFPIHSSIFIVTLYSLFLTHSKTMKTRAIFVGLIALLLSARLSAQGIHHYDSIPIGIVFYASNPMYIDSIKGDQDLFQADIGGSDFYAVQFADENNQVVTMDSGSIMHVYWERGSTDSCALKITFLAPNSAGIEVGGDTVNIIQGDSLFVPHMTTVIVPKSRYNGLQLTVDGNPNVGEAGATTAFVDAIVLLQGGVSAVSQPAASNGPMLRCYPNPFPAQTGTRIAINLSTTSTNPSSGDALLVVTDAMGREVDRVPLGQISSGSMYDSHIIPGTSGIFFVRLMVDGRTIGAPIEISAE